MKGYGEGRFRASVRVPTWFVDEELMDMGPELKVYLLLARWTNRDGETWPARSSLAEWCSITISKLDRYLKKLESRGLIERTPGRGRGKTTVYRLPWDRPERGE